MFNDTVHFVLQSKGGVGKSFIASLLAQYMKKIEGDVLCLDTDQANTTLAYYKSLNAEHINVMSDAMVVDTKKFDGMMQKIFETSAPVLIDNGSNTFAPLSSYMIENDAFQMLADMGKTVFIHVVIGGGDVLVDSANSLASLSKTPGAQVVVWLNEHFGTTDVDGKGFDQTRVVKSIDNLYGFVTLHQRNPQTFGEDIRKMTSLRLTLDEVKTSPDFEMMERHRIATFGKNVFNQLDELFIEEAEEGDQA